MPIAPCVHLHCTAPLINSAFNGLLDQPQGHAGTSHKSQTTFPSRQFICV